MSWFGMMKTGIFLRTRDRTFRFQVSGEFITSVNGVDGSGMHKKHREKLRQTVQMRVK